MTQKENDTIFGKILRGEIPSDVVWEDDKCLAFRDVTPVAPVHILVIPRKYIPTLNDIQENDENLIGHLIYVATQVAQKEGLDGYRLVVNCNEGGGQTVFHLHLHLIGGRDLQWPPG